MDYKEKIKKLLALAESNNEHEAKAALLKAKELMAMHKIEEIDLREVGKKEVKRVRTDYTFTKRGEWWMSNLAHIIAENYCCRYAVTKQAHAQKQNVMFIGFDDDVELCVAVFDYAVKSAKALAAIELKKDMWSYRYSSAEKNQALNSYAIGFALGVKEALEDQRVSNEAEWGLVMVVPTEVNAVVDGFRKDHYKGKRHVVDSAYRSAGFEEGRRFNPNNKLKAV